MDAQTLAPDVISRAYSTLVIKAADDDARVITGVATTPSPDRMGDVVEPLGVKYKNPLPLLWQHRHDQPIGWVKFDKPTKDGITFTATIAKVAEDGTLKDRIDEAWQSIKTGLVRAFSIGFRPLEYSYMDNGGIRFVQCEVIELSAVTIPANADCDLLTIRSIDSALRAALGLSQPGPDRRATPRDGGSLAVKAITPPSGKDPNVNKPLTIAEQISAFEATRQAKAARQTELMNAAGAAGVTLSAEESEEYDTLESEIVAVDKPLQRLRGQQSRDAETVITVDGRTPAAGVASRGGEAPALKAAYGSVQIAPKLEKGILFTRLIGAKYLGMVSRQDPAEIAAKKWKDTPEVEAILRAAVTPGSTTDSTFAEPLVQLNNATGEFIELLRAKEIIGRITGWDRVPFNIKVPRGTGDPAAYWVGEGKVKPVSRGSFDSVSLTFAKVAGIVPMTVELMKFSNPSAEVKVRDGLIAAIAYLTDRDVLDPTKAEAVGFSPASLTNGVTPTTATGTDADAFRSDFASMMEDFADANQDTTGIVLVMTPMQALRFSLMRNALGQREFPEITMNGGVIEGFPVVTSTNIAATGSSPTDGYPIVAINAPDVFLAEEGVDIDMSDQATLEMSDTPDSPATGSTSLVSLWQHNMVALKAERFITWKKKHTSSVQFIQNAKYTT
jgi:HK97 family phage major capsid protein/HK97 family phage prohead protease